MQVSSQLHATADLSAGKGLDIVEKKKLAPAPNRTQTFQPVAIATELFRLLSVLYM
jgi:hypothetical protein